MSKEREEKNTQKILYGNKQQKVRTKHSVKFVW